MNRDPQAVQRLFAQKKAERIAYLHHLVSGCKAFLPSDFHFGQYIGLACIAFQQKCQRSLLATVKHLDLSEHNAPKIPPLTTLATYFPFLVSLDLSDNRIQEASLSSLVVYLPNLEKLALRTTGLQSLDQILVLDGLKQLKSLDVRDNPLPLIDNTLALVEALLSTEITEHESVQAQSSRSEAKLLKIGKRKDSSKGRNDVAI